MCSTSNITSCRSMHTQVVLGRYCWIDMHKPSFAFFAYSFPGALSTFFSLFFSSALFFLPYFPPFGKKTCGTCVLRHMDNLEKKAMHKHRYLNWVAFSSKTFRISTIHCVRGQKLYRQLKLLKLLSKVLFYLGMHILV